MSKSIVEVFGSGTSYDETGLAILKTNWVDFTPSNLNSSKSMLLAIFIKACQALTEDIDSVTLSLAESKSENIKVNGCPTPLQSDIFLVKLTRFNHVEVIDPDLY